jgi:hypothetical protein
VPKTTNIFIPAQVIPNVKEEEAADGDKELLRPHALLMRRLGLYGGK